MPARVPATPPTMALVLVPPEEVLEGVAEAERDRVDVGV